MTHVQKELFALDGVEGGAGAEGVEFPEGTGGGGGGGGCGQRWVIAIKTKIQLPNTLPTILNCAIGIIN